MNFVLLYLYKFPNFSFVVICQIFINFHMCLPTVFYFYQNNKNNLSITHVCKNIKIRVFIDILIFIRGRVTSIFYVHSVSFVSRITSAKKNFCCLRVFNFFKKFYDKRYRIFYILCQLRVISV